MLLLLDRRYNSSYKALRILGAIRKQSKQSAVWQPPQRCIETQLETWKLVGGLEHFFQKKGNNNPN